MLTGKFFVLENCGNNCHLWMEFNTSQLWINEEEEPIDSGEDRTTPEYLRVSSPEDRMAVCISLLFHCKQNKAGCSIPTCDTFLD